MTLNKAKTHLLNGLIADEKALFGLTIITNNDYNKLCDEVATWEQAYNNAALNGTNDDNTTFAFDGIDQFPVPPKR